MSMTFVKLFPSQLKVIFDDNSQSALQRRGFETAGTILKGSKRCEQHQICLSDGFERISLAFKPNEEVDFEVGQKIIIFGYLKFSSTSEFFSSKLHYIKLEGYSTTRACKLD